MKCSQATTVEPIFGKFATEIGGRDGFLPWAHSLTSNSTIYIRKIGFLHSAFYVPNLFDRLGFQMYSHDIFKTVENAWEYTKIEYFLTIELEKNANNRLNEVDNMWIAQKNANNRYHFEWMRNYRFSHFSLDINCKYAFHSSHLNQHTHTHTRKYRHSLTPLTIQPKAH